MNGERNTLRRKALLLSSFTVAYNLAEGVVSVAAGWVAGSVALVGFGLDSGIESLSGVVMVWRFARTQEADEAAEERIERQSEKLVGISLLVLGIYVVYEAVRRLALQEKPDTSVVGIIVAVLSLLVMPWLARSKRLIGERLGSRSLVADSKETVACAWLSAALLLGLGLNSLFGLWWADPVAGLVVAGFLVREAHECLLGDDDPKGPAERGDARDDE